MMQVFGTSLADNLDAEHIAAQELLNLLKEEQAHLIRINVEQLGRLIEEKSILANRMSELAAHRNTLLAEAGFEASESGMRAWVDSVAPTSAITEKWKALLAVAATAKEENRVNGLLLSQHMTRTQSSLNVLQANAQGGTFYGPNGQSATKIASRHLAAG